MHVAEHPWPELSEYVEEESIALLPLGSTEGHGPHLPEGTDAIIADGFAREAAERTGFLCLPPVSIGVSPHHRQFPGTTWVDPPAFRQYVESLSRNLTYHGLDRIVYVNAHGGNVSHLREVGRRLRDDGTAYAVPWMWDESIPELVDEAFERNGPHAGPKEASLVWHLRPELVREEQLAAARDGGAAQFDGTRNVRHGARVAYDAVENSPNGAFGDPTDASPEAGERLFEAATEQLVSLAEWIDDQPFEALMPPERVSR